MRIFQKIVDAITVSMYDVEENSTPNGGDMMTARGIFTVALKATGKTQADCVRLMGKAPQWLNAKLIRNTLRADDFLGMLDMLGIDVAFTIRETGTDLKEELPEVSQRTRKVANSTICDTASCYAIANNFYADRIFTAALKATGKTRADCVRLMGKNPQWLNGKLARNSLRADDFLSMLDVLGIDVVFTVRETGVVLKERIQGAGRRIKKMVNGTIYDTASSDAIANNFYADGVNEYTDGRAMELYINAEGRYFFAEYSENGKNDRITIASAKESAAFILKHGTEIQKAPKK